MPRRSAAFQRIILVLSALAVLGAAAWAAQQVFEPVPVPPIAPPKARVSFDQKKDIRNNPLFQTLQGFVTGVIEPGVVGKQNPFVGPDASQTTGGTTGASGLGVVEEIGLGGSGVIGLSQAPDGSMLALLEGKNGANSVYEVRRFKTDGTVDSPVSWTLMGGASGQNAVLAPASFAQSSDGTIWFVSTAGYVARTTPGATPTWSSFPLIPFGGVVARTASGSASTWSLYSLIPFGGVDVVMRIDGADHIWVTDGLALYGGDGTFFTRTDLTELLPAEALVVIEAHPSYTDALSPAKIQTIAGGRLNVLTGVASFLLPLVTNQQPMVHSLLPTTPDGTLQGFSLAVTPAGDLLYVPEFAILALVSASGTKEFNDPYVLPNQSFSDPVASTITNADALYALDYSATTTILWKMVGQDWTAQVISASGTVPNDTPVQVESDGAGNVWARMKQRGLLRVSPPKRP